MVITNLGAIYYGFILYHLLKPANQIAVQLPVAVILSIAGKLDFNCCSIFNCKSEKQ